jgi:hypothetical protein
VLTWQQQRVVLQRGQKQMRSGPFDDEIVSRMSDRVGGAFRIVHPSLMFRRMRTAWTRRRSAEWVLGQLALAPSSGSLEPVEGLPDQYVAVKAYTSDCLPGTARNRDFVNSVVAGLAARVAVVLLDTGVPLDDHADFEVDVPGVIRTSSLLSPSNNLDIQTRVISQARGFVSTYGGFSYLGPLLGTPTLGFFAEQNFNPMHLDVFRGGLRSLGREQLFALHHTDDARGIESAIARCARDAIAETS